LISLWTAEVGEGVPSIHCCEET